MFFFGTNRYQWMESGRFIIRDGPNEAFVDGPYFNLLYAVPDLIFILMRPVGMESRWTLRRLLETKRVHLHAVRMHTMHGTVPHKATRAAIKDWVDEG